MSVSHPVWEDPENVVRIISWRLSSSDRMKRKAMFCGGFREVIQDVLLEVARRPFPNSFMISTVVCNQVRWSLDRLCKAKIKHIKKLRRFSNEFVEGAECSEFLKIELEERRRCLVQALAEYSEAFEDSRGAKILRMRYYENMARKEVAIVFRVTKQRIRQIECRAIRRMQLLSINSDFLQDYVPVERVPELPRKDRSLKELVEEKLKDVPAKKDRDAAIIRKYIETQKLLKDFERVIRAVRREPTPDYT